MESREDFPQVIPMALFSFQSIGNRYFVMGKEQYISRRDLICWLLKQGTENGKLDTKKRLPLDEIMSGINGLPAVKMAEKEKLLEFGLWELIYSPDGGEGHRTITKQIADLCFEAEKKKRAEMGICFYQREDAVDNSAFRKNMLDAIRSLEMAVSILC